VVRAAILECRCDQTTYHFCSPHDPIRLGHEDGTEKAPVTPGELIPARELEADMHLLAGDYEAARGAYLATLKRERGRARSVFGAARAAELGGDPGLAAAGYRDYLRLMERADASRGELRIARAGAGKQ
jgi:hypothetical protein